MKKNRNIRRRTRNRRGAALILTLVAIAIVAALAASVGNLVYSHQRSAEADRDNARALHLAEAGLILQIQKLSASMREDYAHLAASYGTTNNRLDLTADFRNLNVPISALQLTHFQTTNNNKTIARVADLFRVDPKDGDDLFISQTWVSNPDASGSAGNINIYSSAISAPAQILFSKVILYPKSSGNGISGIQRTVRAQIWPTGVFDDWACFGINALYLRGSNIAIIGKIGTNAYIGKNETTKITGTQTAIFGAPAGQNNITLHDEQFQLPDVSPPPVRFRNAVPLPTITEIANQEAGYCKYGYSAPTPLPYRSSLPINPGGNPGESGPVLFKTNNDHESATYTDADGAQIKETNASGQSIKAFPNDSIQAGAKLTLKGAPYGANYYMTGLNVGGSNGTLQVDLLDGPVNLWIDSKNSKDEIRGSILLINGKADRFRIYYSNSKGKLRLGDAASGAITLNAMIYAYDREPNKDPAGTIEVVGPVNLSGSLIANTLDLAGDNITVSHMKSAGAEPGEGILYLGLAAPWLEQEPLREK